MQNIRDIRIIEFLPGDSCECGARELRAGLECSTPSVKGWCIDSRCSRYQRVRYLDSHRYKPRYWPNEPIRSLGTSRPPKRDPRFVVPFDREQFVYARDGECVHCLAPLSEDVPEHEMDPGADVQSARDPAAGAIPLFELPRVEAVRAPASSSFRLRPSRRPLPRSIDHIVPYWAAIRLAPYLDERSIEILGWVAVVASCPRCNSQRQVAAPEHQLWNDAAANDLVASMQRLFACRVLIESSVDPIADQARFTRSLALLRRMLTGREIVERKTG